MELTIESVAQSLDGVEYLEEHTRIEAAALKTAGVVVAFGASDDLLELHGAIHDEFHAWGGTTLLIIRGRAVSESDLIDAQETLRENVEWIASDILSAGHPTVTAEWQPDGEDCAWKITTTLPYAPFRVMEDGNVFCWGAVFKLMEGE